MKSKTLKNSIKAVLCALLFFAIALFLPVIFSIGDSAEADVKNDNVVYDSVRKNIVIDDKKNCDITETITVTYLRDGINVGLARNVSRINKITRIVDGKKYVKTTKNDLELLSVTMDGEEEYNFLEERGDYFYINTGADGDYKVGKHVYEIHYLYSMGEDLIGAFDDFTFDIMDYGFKSKVGKFSAEITLPKDFLNGKDVAEVLTFRTNGMSPLDYGEVHAVIDSESFKISCSYGELLACHGLTMQLILPQGYFDTAYHPSALYYVTLAVAVAAVAAIALIIFTSRRVFKSVVTVELYPPEGYSPLDTARAYRGCINEKDFAALVVSWAGRGLITINFKGKRDLILTKLKEYDCPAATEYSKYERDFFNGLFNIYDTYDTSKEKLAKTAFKEKLYKAVEKLYKTPKEKKAPLILKKVAISVLSLVPFILAVISCNESMGRASSMLFVVIFPLIALNVFIYFPMPLWFKVLWGAIFGGAPFVALILTSACDYDFYYLIYITAAIFIFGTFSSIFVRAFSKEEKAAHGKVLGFKRFLLLAELDKLNALLEENPDYFYDILPYCYVFGITKKMQKKFSALNVPLPDYFEGETLSGVGRCISHSMHSVCGTSHIGGGGSGGGSSGGGGGGGSGGSSGGGGGGGGCGGR